MERRDFLKSSFRTVLVTSGLFIAGKVITACDKDDDNWRGYYDGYYNGYYDDRPAPPQDANETQTRS